MATKKNSRIYLIDLFFNENPNSCAQSDLDNFRNCYEEKFPILKDEFEKFCKDIEAEADKRRQTQKISLTNTSKRTETYNEVVGEPIKNYFPKTTRAAEACATLEEARRIGSLTQPIGILITGAPSGQKTTALRFFKYQHATLWLDDFSAAAFVSHQSGATETQLKEKDLLPKFQNACVISPEFASILEGNKENVAQKLGRLTRIMDGDGFISASGTQGIRGYRERFSFVVMVASVPLSADQWDAFMRAGARFFFLNIKEEQNFEDMLSNIEFEKSIKEIQQKMAAFFNCVPNEKPIISEHAQKFCFELAKYTAKLRGIVSSKGVRFIKDEREVKYFETDRPIIEHPSRLYSMFCALAEGHASLFNRKNVEKEDLEFVQTIALDSGRFERVMFLSEMPRRMATVKEIVGEMKFSKGTIQNRLAQLVALGLVRRIKNKDVADKPTYQYEPIPFIASLEPISEQTSLSDEEKAKIEFGKVKEGENAPCFTFGNAIFANSTPETNSQKKPENGQNEVTP